MPIRVNTFITIGVLVIFVFACGYNIVQATITQEPDEINEFDLFSVQLIVVLDHSTFNIYEGIELANLQADLETSPTNTYSNLSDVPLDRDVQVIYLGNDSILDSLDSADISMLNVRAEGGAVIGICGPGEYMREVLSITDSSDQAHMSNPYNIMFFTYAVPDGARDDLTLCMDGDPTTGKLLALLSEWLMNTREAHQPKAQDGGAWNATYTHEWKGLLSEGSYRFLINVFKLETDNVKNDWYLVQTSYQSAIDIYEADTNFCGYFTYAMNLQAEVDPHSDASLYEYMPTGTVSNSTRAFTIGANLSAKGGLIAQYTQSYSTPDVTIADRTSYVTNTARWDVSFRIPDYWGYPLYAQPSLVARTSYEIQPAFIVQTPKNKQMVVELHPKIGQQLDYIYFNIPLVKGFARSERYYWTDDTLTVKVGP